MAQNANRLVCFLIVFVQFFVCVELRAQYGNGASAEDYNRGTACLLEYANSRLGIKEKTGRNDGPEIDRMLRLVGSPLRSPWCGAYIGDIFYHCGFKIPRLAGAARAWFTKDKLVPPALAQPTDVIGIWYNNLGRIGHIAMIEAIGKVNYITNEGNTNAQGSREGNVSARRIRHKSMVKYVARHRELRKPP